MNDYLVQYASTTSRVFQWTTAENHIEAAANVLIDKGFSTTFENDLVLVVCKKTWHAGVYSLADVRTVADGRLGLTCFPDDPADEWKKL